MSGMPAKYLVNKGEKGWKYGIGLAHLLALGMDDEGLIFIVPRIDHSGGGIFKEIL